MEREVEQPGRPAGQMHRSEQHGGLQGEPRSSVSPAGPQVKESRLSHPLVPWKTLCQKTVLSQAKISSDSVKDKEGTED